MNGVWRQLSQASVALSAGLAVSLVGILGLAGFQAARGGSVAASQEASPTPQASQMPVNGETPPSTQPEGEVPAQDPDRVSDQEPEAPEESAGDLQDSGERTVELVPAVYDIEHGDTLAEISRKTGVSVDRLAQANGIVDVNWIYAGSSMAVPVP